MLRIDVSDGDVPRHLVPKDSWWSLRFVHDTDEIVLWTRKTADRESETGRTPVACRRTRAFLHLMLPARIETEYPVPIYEISGTAHCSPTDRYNRERGRTTAMNDLYKRLTARSFANAPGVFVETTAVPDFAARLTEPTEYAYSIRRRLAAAAMAAYFRRPRRKRKPPHRRPAASPSPTEPSGDSPGAASRPAASAKRPHVRVAFKVESDDPLKILTVILDHTAASRLDNLFSVWSRTRARYEHVSRAYLNTLRDAELHEYVDSYRDYRDLLRRVDPATAGLEVANFDREQQRARARLGFWTSHHQVASHTGA